MEILPFTIGVMMVLGGGWLMHYGFFIKKRRIEDVYRWPKAKGKVLNIKVQGKGPKVVGSNDYRSYYFNLKYQYQVDGQVYTSDKVQIGSDIIVKSDVDKATSMFPEGSDVEVFYNAQNPQQAVLLPEGVSGKPNSEGVMGCLIVAVGTILAYMNSGLVT